MPLLGETYKWKLGAHLTATGKDELVGVLEANRGEFDFSVKELGEYKGEPMEIEVDTKKAVFTPTHRLSAAEWGFSGKHCVELEALGMMRPSQQSKYAPATVVVRKKDEAGEYTDYRHCGDYCPIPAGPIPSPPHRRYI